MAPMQTVPQLSGDSKSVIGRTGVLMLSGFGLRIRVANSHLEIEDGVGLKRRKFRLPRVNHSLKRLVCISDDGYTSLSALKWLSDVRASFVLLNRDGRVTLVTGPTAPSDVRLRRAQALAFGNGIGLELCRKLIDGKLEGQQRLAREQLNDPIAADEIAVFRGRLPQADTAEAIRNVEAQAALRYFAGWRNIPVLWPTADLRRIPGHWRTVGNRQSPLSGGPRLAVTPVHAILNYAFALLEAETRLSICALGLDPALGLGLHTDTPNRDSLVFDVLEPVRPQVESWVLNWITCEPLRKNDFFETPNGNCRLKSALCTKLSETAPTWGRLVAPWAEYIAHSLWAGRSGSAGPATRLTQRHKREAKGRAPLPPTLPAPRRENLCRGCGKAIRDGRTHCAQCAVPNATERLIDAARVGRMAAHTSDARAKQATTQRRNATLQHAWNPACQPAWLTDKFYSEKIQPRLAHSSVSAIARHISVSRAYASQIRQGHRPHRRQWLALAGLVGYFERIR